MKSQRRSYLKLAIALCLALLLGVGLYFGVHTLEKYLVDRADSEVLSGLTADEFGRVEYNGKKYEQKVRISTTLVIGVDNSNTSEDDSPMSDFIALYVFDEVEEKSTVIQINRDTMTKVPVIGILGDKAGEKYQQIAYAHSYGNGKNESCRNTADAVSELFYEIPVNNYVSVRMDAIPILNDKVGGVELEIKNDFSAVDPTLEKGKIIRLTGEQALTYVRARGGVGDQTNVSRMERQKQYMSAFVESFVLKSRADKAFAIEAIEAVEDYIVTDCTVAELAELAGYVTDHPVEKIIIPKGESKLGTKYMEHYLDEDSLMDLVIDIFYEEMK